MPASQLRSARHSHPNIASLLCRQGTGAGGNSEDPCGGICLCPICVKFANSSPCEDSRAFFFALGISSEIQLGKLTSLPSPCVMSLQTRRPLEYFAWCKEEFSSSILDIYYFLLRVWWESRAWFLCLEKDALHGRSSAKVSGQILHTSIEA